MYKYWGTKTVCDTSWIIRNVAVLQKLLYYYTGTKIYCILSQLALLYCHIPFDVPLKLSALMVVSPVLHRRTEEVETDFHCTQHPLPGKRCAHCRWWTCKITAHALLTYRRKEENEVWEGLMYVIFGKVKKDWDDFVYIIMTLITSDFAGLF